MVEALQETGCRPSEIAKVTADNVNLAARIWVSLERNMKCGVGLCGHCQLGAKFVCRDGPVFRWDRTAPLLAVQEL